MGQKTKNQHYVPRMYLKRFAPDGKRICVWNLQTDTILTRQSPENYAAKKYYYDTNATELKNALNEIETLYPSSFPKIDLSDEQFVEKALSRIEGDASKTMSSICEKHESLYDETNMQKLIIFLHDLAYRSEKYRTQIDYICNSITELLTNLGISDDKIAEVGGSGKDNQLYQLMGIAPLLKTAQMLVEGYNWYIGTVSGKMKLIISDNPAQGIMLGFNDICIPLDGQTAIIFRVKNTDAPIISQDMPSNNEIELTERSVFAYNAIQMSYANRFLFGDKDSLSFLRKMSLFRGGYAKMFGERPSLHNPLEI